MKSAFRAFLLLSAVLAAATLSGCQRRYDVEPDPTPRFESIKKLETDSPEHAVDEYAKLKTEYGNANAKSAEEYKKYREFAAQALLRSSQLGYQLLDPNRPIDPTLSATAKGEKEAQIFAVSDKAHLAVKELFEQFPDSDAAKIAKNPASGENGLGLREAMEQRIDRRNRILPSYKIIDGLVNLTGAKPALSYWFALVVIAFIVKLVTLPITLKMYKSQRKMQQIQPHLKALQDRHKEKIAKATGKEKMDLQNEMNASLMAAYKEHGVNPLASCFPMLIQLPFLWWVYNMIRLYEFHFSNGTFLWINPSTAQLAPSFIGANLGHFDMILLVLYAGSNYMTMKLTPPTDPNAAQQQKQMSIMMTFMMFYMFMIYKWSAAFTFYWLVLNIIGTTQQYHYIYKPNKAKAADGEGVTLPSMPEKPSKPSLATSPSNGSSGSGGSRPRPRRKGGNRPK